MPSSKRIANPVVDKNSQELTINEIAVRSVYPSRLKYSGAVSGKEYFWEDSGAIVMVLSEDVPSLLSKRIGNRGCCGAVNEDGNRVFELA
jgi:hypothetical protein